MMNMRNLLSVSVACLSLVCSADVSGNTEWQDVPPDTQVGSVVGSVVTKEYVEGLGIEAGISTRAASNITFAVVREDVRTNYLCTVDAASQMTNDVIGTIGEHAIAAVSIHKAVTSEENAFSVITNVYDVVGPVVREYERGGAGVIETNTYVRLSVVRTRSYGVGSGLYGTMDETATVIVTNTASACGSIRSGLRTEVVELSGTVGSTYANAHISVPKFAGRESFLPDGKRRDICVTFEYQTISNVIDTYNHAICNIVGNRRISAKYESSYDIVSYVNGESYVHGMTMMTIDSVGDPFVHPVNGKLYGRISVEVYPNGEKYWDMIDEQKSILVAAGVAADAKISPVAQAVYGLEEYMTNDYIRAANPAFSNEVMRVGIGLDSQTVAQINAILTDIGETPIGTVTTVGGLLAALAAAVAWLKQKTASIEATVGTANGDLADALGGGNE